MSKKKEKVKVLSEELSAVKNYVQFKSSLRLPEPGGRKKNAYDSINYREKANALYKSKNHNEKIHEQIWRTYTQSIALAPNNSEELASGYGNRAALWFHLKKYKDCIKDCDLALSITKSDNLKLKLLTRKAECLLELNDREAGDVSKEALQMLENLHLNDGATKVWDGKLQDILSASSKTDAKLTDHNEKIREKYMRDLSNFPRSEEVPCASKSVEIKYNKKLGRHIVATDDIKPGDIFAIEKNYFTHISREGMYLYCSNCANYAFTSIPCEHCIFDVYCSESCRTEAWNKYHQWECAVFPHLWDIDENVEVCLFVMRFTFTALSEVGGLSNMKKLLAELDEHQDPRTKGFTNGCFDVNTAKSIYSLSKHPIDPDINQEFIQLFCNDAYLVAKHTTFFGYKMHMSVAEIFQNKDVLFFAALLHHSHHIMHFNASHISFLRNDQIALYATNLKAFCSLLNHDCDPNIAVCIGKNNKMIHYAIKPIKKGSQLVTSYIGKNFLQHPKEYRQDYLKNVYHFTCKCQACTENWTSNKLQKTDKYPPGIKRTMRDIIGNMTQFQKIISRGENDVVYSPKIMRDIVYFLEATARKVTSNCDLYQNCLECLEKMFEDVFESFHFTLPDKC